MKRRDVEAALREQGCQLLRSTGDHDVYGCACGRHIFGASTPQSDLAWGCPGRCQAADLPAGRVAAVTTTYKVTARRWELGWELHVDGFGVTQVATLASAGRVIRDYVAALTDADPGEIVVDYQIELDDEFSAEIAAAREASREAERLQQEAAARWRAVARQLSKDRHMARSDVAAVLDVSPQRVSQLLNP